ncbi:hypothetical protein BGX28_006264 [Mortierella sp. GBA30]|nr:hypothetical protein BGX28_006264 [Mortierella sp. GBA30]
MEYTETFDRGLCPLLLLERTMTGRHMDIEALDSLTINATQFDVDHRPVQMDVTCKTIIGNEELKAIRKSKNIVPVGIYIGHKLHRQIELQTGGRLELSMNFGCHVMGSFEMRHITLEESQRGHSDHMIYGEGIPQQIISLGHSDDSGYGGTAHVHSFEIASSGTHAVTLCFISGAAIIEIWDMRTSNEKSSFGPPQLHRTPCARASIPAPTIIHPDLMDICLTISSSGSEVALHSVEKSKDGIPCHIFRKTLQAPADHDMSKPSSLQQSVLCDGLDGYFGYGSFHVSAIDSRQQVTERYITCDGIAISIYSIMNNWTLIYSLTLSLDPNPEAALALFLSIRGRHFAWTGSKGVVSVWDLETGRHVSYIPVESDGNSVYTQMSRDGSKIAISVNGLISIHQTTTGVKLGEHQQRPGEDNYFEVVLEQNHFMVLDKDMRKVVSTRDMSIAKTLRIHPDYKVQYPVPLGDPVFAYAQGSVVNVVRIDNPVTAEPEKCDEHCHLYPVQVDLFLQSNTLEYSYNEGPTFTMASSQALVRGKWMTMLTIACSGFGRSRHTTIPLGPSQIFYSGVFLAVSSQLLLVTGRYLQIWNLSAEASKDVCELALVWDLESEYKDQVKADRLRKVTSARACKHGSHLALDLLPTSRPKRQRQFTSSVNRDASETITLPISSADSITSSEEYRLVHGVRCLLDMYIDGDPGCKRAVIEYLGTLVRPSAKCPTSCITALCQFWLPSKASSYERILAELLPQTRITWIPDPRAAKTTDPLAILLRTAETQTEVIGAAKVIMDYCVVHANSSKNLSFLSPIFGSMHDLLFVFPTVALDCLNRIAFIPAKQRSYIIHNHLVTYHPDWRFWKSSPKLLQEMEDPIMQLYVTSPQPDPSNDKFTKPVFMSSFDALWIYHDIPVVPSASGSTWFETLLYMIRFKLHIRNKTYVECYDYNLRSFDNPAIAALVTYKWNTIGYKYWLLRFILQCFYYCLVVIAAIIQVYARDARSLTGVFFAIILMAVAFVWLEFQRAMKIRTWYKRSKYNVLSFLAYCLPIAASIDQLVVISQGDLIGNARLLSFSVLVVSLQMLIELQVSKGVCKYLTIIHQSFAEIKVLFIIFAAGILAFTVAMLHLLYACPTGGCTVNPDSKFPIHFLGAISSTYFFMGGKYFPVSDKFQSQDWAFHIAMILFFFFTVLLMMNVLIALLTVSSTKGDEGWRLAWIKSRLRYIESAENLSYHIPGFRQSHSWFPREIYFTATLEQIEDYREKQSFKARCQTKCNGTVSDHYEIDTAQKRWAQKQQQQHQEQQQQQIPDILQQGDISARELKATMANIVAALTDIQKDIRDIREPTPVKRTTRVTFDDAVQTRQLRDPWDSYDNDDDDDDDDDESQQDSEETLETRSSPLAKAI